MLLKDIIENMPKGEIIKNGLVFWVDGKDFQNNPPTSNLRDRSGYGNNLTSYSFAYTSTSGSDTKDGVVFDGVDDSSIIASPSFGVGVTTLARVTLEVCINVNSYNTSNSTPFLDGWDYNNNTGFSLRAFNGQFSFVIANGSIYSTCGFASLPDAKTWLHVVGTYDGSAQRIYINGTQVAILSKVGFVITMPLAIRLGYMPTNGGYLNGAIRYARIYNHALSQQEILQNYYTSR